MSITIERPQTNSEALWRVCFSSQSIQFRDAASAEAFAARLKSRIAAPHSYSALWRPQAER
ncbi:MAG: hypothetical protein ACRERY_16285 [Pseudomonas sp.]